MRHIDVTGNGIHTLPLPPAAGFGKTQRSTLAVERQWNTVIQSARIRKSTTVSACERARTSRQVGPFPASLKKDRVLAAAASDLMVAPAIP